MDCTCFRPRYREGEPVPPTPPCHCQARARCADRPLYEWQGSGPTWSLIDMRTLIQPASISLVDSRYWVFALIGGMNKYLGSFGTLQKAQERAEEAAGVSAEVT